jgi:hypothetical protein
MMSKVLRMQYIYTSGGYEWTPRCHEGSFLVEINTLLHKRCLLKVGGRLYHNQDVQEYRVLEISPSGQWVKLMNLYGNKFWKPRIEIAFVEELQDLCTEPKPRES